MIAPARPALERLLPLALGLTVIFSGLGSSIEPHLNSVGHLARWLGLLAVAGLSTWVAVRRRLWSPLSSGEVLLLAFGSFALLSALWSPWPRTSFAHAAAFGIVLVGAVCVGRVYRSRSSVAEPSAALALAGGVLLVGGLALAVVSPLDAFQIAPFRYRGLGENPNTVPLLAVLDLPLMLCLYLTTRTRLRRRLAMVGLVLSIQTIFLAGSRGAIVAGLLAMIVQVALAPRKPLWRVRAFAIVFAVLLYGLFSGSIVGSAIKLKDIHIHNGHRSPKVVHVAHPAASSGGGSCSTSSPVLPTRPRAAVANTLPSVSISAPKITGVLALVLPRASTFFTGSGRLSAWRAGIHLGERRPVGGYGFGTESLAFCKSSRALLSVFEGSYVENSYIGLFLQLGLPGVGLFLLFVAAVLVRGVRVARRSHGDRRLWAGALVAVLVAGLVQALVQSYVYSPGNIATLTLFVSIVLLMNRGADDATAGRQGIGRFLSWRTGRSRTDTRSSTA